MVRRLGNLGFAASTSVLFVVLLFGGEVVAPASAAPEADLIASLPAWKGSLPSRQYSGYLDIPGTKKHLHYWFVESYNKPADDPVVLWLNGGPGCSSLDGFFYEHGPWRINETDGSLYEFEYTWANQANMIYLESPVGVGFSYSDDPADYACNDDQTASDSVAALEQFFTKKFPELASNDFFILGESYGGIYVPTLAEGILKATFAGTYRGAPLRAIGVGNGCSGTEIGVCGGERDRFDGQYFSESTGFLEPSLKQDIIAECNFLEKDALSARCKKLLDEMYDGLGGIDIYNVYGSCISGSAQEVEGSKWSKAAPVGGPGPNACLDSISASNYLNQKEVQDAIHVKPISFRWKTCGTVKGWSYNSTRPNLPRDTYPVLNKHIRVVIYNGDWDACVPYTDAVSWTEGMGYDVAEAWHPWLYKTEGRFQVGGYATRYKTPHNFTFITIRGGRHEVPETAPEKAFELLRRVLDGTSF